jgi:hypothetical protein
MHFVIGNFIRHYCLILREIIKIKKQKLTSACSNKRLKIIEFPIVCNIGNN